MSTNEEMMIKYRRKLAKANGMVAAIVEQYKVPKMCWIQQKFDDSHIEDIEGEVRRQLQRKGTLDKIKPGQSIAIGTGSRGVANIARIVKTMADEIKRVGANPFIIPAMGSHGGATAEGQRQILAGYGITEEAMGCPVRSSMETVQVGVTPEGFPVYVDKYAFEADGIVTACRVKPHTAFRGKYESGILKMLTIGLGKQKGAESCHFQGFKYMHINVVNFAKVIMEKTNVLFSVATIENAYDQTKKITAVPVERFLEEEPPMLIEAKANMPKILFDEMDVLIVDEVGKNFSGDGADPNITGSFTTPYATGGANKQRYVILDISDESHGHGGGLGAADFSTQRAFDKFDFEITYPNVLTSTSPHAAKIPVIVANDKLAIQGAIQTCNDIDHDNPRIVRIKNTLSLKKIQISEALLDEARKNPDIEILSEPEALPFDENGNLF